MIVAAAGGCFLSTIVSDRFGFNKKLSFIMAGVIGSVIGIASMNFSTSQGFIGCCVSVLAMLMTEKLNFK